MIQEIKAQRRTLKNRNYAKQGRINKEQQITKLQVILLVLFQLSYSYDNVQAKGFSKDVIKEIKARRRTMKNRDYAKQGRINREHQITKLQVFINMLK